MANTKINLLTKRNADKPWMIHDFIATKLTEKQFSRLQAINPDTLGEYHFIPADEVDFSWWNKVEKKLTNTRIKQAYFAIDFYGNVTEEDY